MLLRLSLVGAVLLLAPPALAGERLRVRVGAETPYSECFCRAKGRFFPVGESACLSHAEGPRLATCGMEQNVTSWRFSKTACPDS